MARHVWQAGRFEIGLDKPKIMGIVNLTPDSFSDGGAYSQNAQTALAHAERLLKEGADILDIGGESTRLGADYVSPEEEWARVEPCIGGSGGGGRSRQFGHAPHGDYGKSVGTRRRRYY
ncbi:dihydropteroate synthase [Neisseria meningitidis]|nr:dihydropteroate synthase [Neisseria meningitidis]